MKRPYIRFKRLVEDGGWIFKMGIEDWDADFDPIYVSLCCYPLLWWIARPEDQWPGESLVFAFGLSGIQLVLTPRTISIHDWRRDRGKCVLYKPLWHR